MTLPRRLEDDVMRLSGLLFDRDRKRFMQLVSDLMESKHEPISLLGLLLRNFRIAYKIALFPDKSDDMIGHMLGLNRRQMQSMRGVRSCPLGTIKNCMMILQSAAGDIKSGKLSGPLVFVISMGELIKEVG